VETALLLPVFLVVLLSIFDLGRGVYAYSTIGNAARSAGRVAIVDQTVGTVETRAAENAVALGTSAGDVSICYEPADSLKRTCPSADEDDNCAPKVIGCLVLVEVRYQFNALTPLVGLIVGPISMSSTTVLPIERVFPTPP
jgi:hypothetical protein